MKATRIAAILALSMSLFGATSCGAKKTATGIDKEKPSVVDGAELQAETKSQTLAERKAATREWGIGTAPDRALAGSIAEAQARTKYAATIGTIVEGAIGIENDLEKKAATDDKKTVSVGDHLQATTQDIKNIIDNIAVSGTVVINTDTYKRKNGTYDVYVCIEYMGDYLDLEKDLVKEYTKTLEDKVSDADRDKLEDRIEKFRKSVSESLDKKRRMSKVGQD